MDRRDYGRHMDRNQKNFSTVHGQQNAKTENQITSNYKTDFAKEFYHITPYHEIAFDVDEYFIKLRDTRVYDNVFIYCNSIGGSTPSGVEQVVECAILSKGAILPRAEGGRH